MSFQLFLHFNIEAQGWTLQISINSSSLECSCDKTSPCPPPSLSPSISYLVPILWKAEDLKDNSEIHKHRRRTV